MNIVPQLIESLKFLEQNIFTISTNLEPLMLNDSVHSSLETELDNLMISELISNCISNINSLNSILKPIASSVKRATYKHKQDRTQPYANFIIDEPPVMNRSPKKPNYTEILNNTDKVINPIKRRKHLEYTGCCTQCGAPNEYIYTHTKSQHKCKICGGTFSLHPTYHEEIVHRCPHCENKLVVRKERSSYDVLGCVNDKCTFYTKNRRLHKRGQAEHLKTNTGSYKLRYSFRLFDFEIDQVKSNLPFKIDSTVNLNKIHHSKYTVGLILTYYVNYGLSSRKTSKIMSEIHGIKISHQTIVNYAEAVAAITESLNDSFEYDLSNTITFDETYIKVKGKNKYVFFGSDTDKKIITSYRIFDNRDTKNAVITLQQTFNKYRELPKQLNIVTDANPIYNAAQVFYAMNNVNFDLYQVVGVKNNDKVSRTWRSYKQAEERLNRTYKQNYHGTNGYGTLRNANVYMSLYVTFFNFLRTHSSLNYRTPIIINSIAIEPLMPNKWIKLISHTLKSFKNIST